MALILNPKLRAFFLGLDTSFMQALQLQVPLWSKVASLKTSTTEEEVYAWHALLPEMREWVGERQFLSLASRYQTIKNRDFERSFEVPQNVIEDDRGGIFSGLPAELGRVAGLWPDQLVFDAIAAGTSQLAHDGQYFFDTDHPVNPDDPNSAVQSNKFDYSGSGGFTGANLADARSKMASLKADSGSPLEVRPNILLVPPAQEFAAKQLMHTETVGVAIGSAAAAVQNVLKGSMEVVVAPRLAGTPNVIYLLDCSRGTKPFIFQQRKAPQFVYRDRPTDPNVFLRKELQFGVDARGAAGYGPWFFAARMQVA